MNSHNTESRHRPAIVVCPLQHEARALRRALRNLGCDVHCCGPGSAGVGAWAARSNAALERQRGSPIVILAGLCGSLRTEFPAGTAHVIAEVRDGHGAVVARPSLVCPSIVGLIIAQADRVHVNRASRAALALASGTDLVDLESAEFARLAHARGWRWAIVRGVSDDPETTLPADAAAWIAPDGRTRLPVVAWSVMRRPALLGDLKRLRDNSRRALDACAAQIRALLEYSVKETAET